jgi:Ferritin-like domain
MTVASLPEILRCSRWPKISEILLAVSRHSPGSQLRSKILWMGKCLLKMKLRLEGFPNMQLLDPLHIGQGVKEVLDCDLQAEMSARALYEEAATYCHSVKDYVTRDLFEALIRRSGRWQKRSIASAPANPSSGCGRRCLPLPGRLRREAAALAKCGRGQRSQRSLLARVGVTADGNADAR